MKASLLSTLCLFFILPNLLFAQCWDEQVNFPDTFLQDVHFIDDQIGWVVGGNGLVQKTTNGGMNWAQEDIGTSDGLTGVYFFNEATGWAVGDGDIWKYNDGSDWSPVVNPSSQELRDVYFATSQIGWAVGFDGTILKSFNGGSEWSVRTSNTNEALSSLFFIDDQTGWVVGSEGIVLKSTNGGDTWPFQTSITGSHLESVYFVNAQLGWTVGEGGIIFRTTDGGNTWVEQSSGVDNDLKDVHFLDSRNGWIVGEMDLVLRTRDGGFTWASQTIDPAGNIQAVFLTDAQNGWAVSNSGSVYNYSGGIELSLIASNVTGNLGEMVRLDILTEGFSLEDASFSLQWDTTFLDFLMVDEGSFNLDGLQIDDFNQDLVSIGRLGLSWHTPGEVTGVPDQTSIFQVVFQVKGTGCLNSPIKFTNIPTLITANFTTVGCRSIKLNPGLLIVPCDLPVNIPGLAETVANTEYLDTVEWTHYFNQDTLENDTILISVKKNGQDIGAVGDGVFDLKTNKDMDITDITELIQDNVLGFENINSAFALNYFWEVTPNYGDSLLDTTLGLRFYFSEEDLDFLRTSLDIPTLEATDLRFFKLSVEPEKSTCDNLSGVENPEIDVFVHAAQSAEGKWTLDQLENTNSLVGEMDIAGFSCGGIFVTNPLIIDPVQEISNLNHLAISPNPSNGVFNLNLWLKKPDQFTLYVFNSLGRVAYQSKLLVPDNAFQSELQLDHLPAGLYYLQLQNEKGEQAVQKLMISR